MFSATKNDFIPQVDSKSRAFFELTAKQKIIAEGNTDDQVATQNPISRPVVRENYLQRLQDRENVKVRFIEPKRNIDAFGIKPIDLEGAVQRNNERNTQNYMNMLDARARSKRFEDKVGSYFAQTQMQKFQNSLQLLNENFLRYGVLTDAQRLSIENRIATSDASILKDDKLLYDLVQDHTLFIWYESFVQMIKDTITEGSKAKIQDYFLDKVVNALMSLGRVVPDFFRRRSRRPTSGAEGGFGSMPPVTSSPTYYGGFDPTNPPRQPPNTFSSPVQSAPVVNVPSVTSAPVASVPAASATSAPLSQADARGDYDSRTPYERGEAPRVVISAGGTPAAGRVGGFFDTPLGPNLVADAARDVGQGIGQVAQEIGQGVEDVGRGIGEMIRPTDTGGSVVASPPPAQTSAPVSTASPTTLNEMSLKGKLFTYAFACVIAGGSLIQQLGGMAILQRDWEQREVGREIDIVRNTPFRNLILRNFANARDIGDNTIQMIAAGGTELLERIRQSYFGQQMLQVGVSLTPQIIAQAITAVYNRGAEVIQDFGRELQRGGVRVEEHHQPRVFGIYGQQFVNDFTRSMELMSRATRDELPYVLETFNGLKDILMLRADNGQALQYAVDNANRAGTALDFCFSVFDNLHDQVGTIVTDQKFRQITAIYNRLKNVVYRPDPTYDVVQPEEERLAEERAAQEARPEEVAAPSVVSLTTLRDTLDRIRRATRPVGAQGRPRYTPPEAQRLAQEIKTALNQVRQYMRENVPDVLVPYPEITFDATQIDKVSDLKNTLIGAGAPRNKLRTLISNLDAGEFRTYLQNLLDALKDAIPTR